MTDLTRSITVPLSFADAQARIRELLAEQGFGILTEIDVQATFAKKLGAEPAETLGDYVILGACNPTLAQKALSIDPDMGVLLPCNVVVRRAPGDTVTTVQSINAQTMVQLSSEPAIADVASEADARLQSALRALQASAQ